LGAKVPALYDSFAKHETAEPFLLMEFIPGLRFDEWLRTSAPVNSQKGVLITRAIAETIKLCHEHAIGHRDLKPSNIILKDGNITSPYILDFGICFDSRQTMILTREGEMFWNEFIILPECQDLEGGHRDLRSDITALVGVFFSCLTGRPPIVLRDAEDRAPHQRHEKLVTDSAASIEQGERLMWFFDTGFAFRISDRFQTMDEFTTELARFADNSSEGAIDVLEQFDILNQTVQSTDRNVQLGLLRTKYQKALAKINQSMDNEMLKFREHGANLNLHSLHSANFKPSPNLPLDSGDLLTGVQIQIYYISREHYQSAAVVALIAFGVGMDVHLFAAGYTSPANNLYQPMKPLAWSKIAVIDQSEAELYDRSLSVVLDALKSKLAHELRNLARQGRTP